MFANDLIALIEALDTGPVHVVSWSSGIRTVLAATIKRPDLFKSAVHFEPVEGNIFADDQSVESLSAAWSSKWKPVFERLDAGDDEGSAERLLELVFELEPGEFHQEKELQKEVVRQNARTLPIHLPSYDKNKIKLTCDYVSQSKLPTLIVYGGTTHRYWQIMSEKFADCLPDAALKIIAGVNHRAPIEAIDEFSELVLDFADKNSQ